MIIRRYDELIPVPWKNGGGVTREISRDENDGALAWRLSIADVGAEGPFSLFPGMRRVLTVIEGRGMVLEVAGQANIPANLNEPVAFSGDELVNGVLPNGPCRDFNVIWNPSLVRVSVSVVVSRDISFARVENERLVVFCVDGAINLSASVKLGRFDTALLQGENDGAVQAENSSGLLIKIAPASNL